MRGAIPVDHGIIYNIVKDVMHRTGIIMAVLLAVVSTQGLAVASSTSADNRNAEGSTGVTIADLGRGLKSAAQNIEKEIPKMGSAIGRGFKKITEKSPEKPSSQEPAKQSK